MSVPASRFRLHTLCPCRGSDGPNQKKVADKANHKRKKPNHMQIVFLGARRSAFVVGDDAAPRRWLGGCLKEKKGQSLCAPSRLRLVSQGNIKMVFFRAVERINSAAEWEPKGGRRSWPAQCCADGSRLVGRP
ncbi:hypothetical protein TW95_gp0922 [Pandoravirus inopinatum]|uniref:Uncharacterized protein n=1 Tax=Pandoravirus inopinatum TaxID=1605721 RepID=A0A0B5J9X4_9VIRU|nr:hypothetical protein TW95_gp0922 [Pandoravirus inopinatum]AJF97656.1 hypothetical protein [Pandoravirus inopinatum]